MLAAGPVERWQKLCLGVRGARRSCAKHNLPLDTQQLGQAPELPMHWHRSRAWSIASRRTARPSPERPLAPVACERARPHCIATARNKQTRLARSKRVSPAASSCKSVVEESAILPALRIGVPEMLTAIALVCSLTVMPDLREFSRDNAVSVLRVPKREPGTIERKLNAILNRTA